jgi:maleylpyruvate isomerase
MGVTAADRAGDRGEPAPTAASRPRIVRRVQDAERDRDIAGAEAAHRRLLDLLAEHAGTLDPSAPSRLPAWTIGHVLTHLARNADSIVRVLHAAARGEVVERYAGGAAGRERDIAAGHGRSAGELLDDVQATTERLEQAWSAATDWSGRSGETNGAEIPVSDLPRARWREVEVHAVDLGLGYEPADWPGEFVRLQLRGMEMRWNARRPMGLTGLPPEALAVDPRTRLAWLFGRTEIPGLAPARLL